MRQGTTLPELMVVLVIIGILAAIVLPSLRDFHDRAAVASATSEVVAVIGAARHTAIVEGRFVAVHFDSGSSGVLTVSVHDTLQRRNLQSVHGVRLAATRDSIAFTPTGRGYGAANTRIVLRRGRVADTVLTSRLGRVRH